MQRYWGGEHRVLAPARGWCVWGGLSLGRVGGEGRGTGRTHPEVHSQSRVQRQDVTSGQGEKSILFEMRHGCALHVTSRPGASTCPHGISTVWCSLYSKPQRFRSRSDAQSVSAELSWSTWLLNRQETKARGNARPGGTWCARCLVGLLVHGSLH